MGLYVTTCSHPCRHITGFIHHYLLWT